MRQAQYCELLYTHVLVHGRCGHCKQLAPEYRAAAATLKESGAVLTKIDATKFEEVAMSYDIEGYPTLFWVQGTSKKQFNGERNRWVLWVQCSGCSTVQWVQWVQYSGYSKHCNGYPTLFRVQGTSKKQCWRRQWE